MTSSKLDVLEDERRQRCKYCVARNPGHAARNRRSLASKSICRNAAVHALHDCVADCSEVCVNKGIQRAMG